MTFDDDNFAVNWVYINILIKFHLNQILNIQLSMFIKFKHIRSNFSHKTDLELFYTSTNKGTVEIEIFSTVAKVMSNQKLETISMLLTIFTCTVFFVLLVDF